MAENFFLDNADLQFELEELDLSEVIEIKEKGYSYASQYPAAPRNYADAKDNYRILLEVLGDVCAQVIAPRAAEADEQADQPRPRAAQVPKVVPGRDDAGDDAGDEAGDERSYD